MLRNVLLRAAGHDPVALPADRRETHGLVHVGWAVVMAAGVAGANWAAAGFHFAGSHAAIKIGVAAAVGIVGAAIVAIVDRGAVYNLDTQRGWGLVRAAPFLLLRAAIAVVISGVTAQAVMPLFLRAENAEHALKLRERSDAERQHRLTVQLDLPQHRAAVATAQERLRAAEAAIALLPPPVRAKFEEAERSRRLFVHRWMALQDEGVERDEIRRRTAGLYARWQRGKAAAEAAGAEYVAAARKKADDARQAEEMAKAKLGDAESEFDRRMREAREVEKGAITPDSARVLASLLAENPELRLKYWSITALILAFELLAFLVKLSSPPSSPGARIAADRDIAVAEHTCRRREEIERLAANGAIAVAQHKSRRQAALYDLAADEEVRRIMGAAMAAAMRHAEIQDGVRKAFATKLAALVPFEVFRAVTREMTAGETRIAALIRRFPDYARAISEAWRSTVEDAVAMLRDPEPSGSAPRP